MRAAETGRMVGASVLGRQGFLAVAAQQFGGELCPDGAEKGVWKEKRLSCINVPGIGS